MGFQITLTRTNAYKKMERLAPLAAQCVRQGNHRQYLTYVQEFEQYYPEWVQIFIEAVKVELKINPAPD